MNTKSIAPCGINCDICLGFQREKNKCVGCNNEGNKPRHCTICSIKYCKEKGGEINTKCNLCSTYPCRKIINLDKRYRIKYGESIIKSFERIGEIGIRKFIKEEEEKWKCPQCGNLVCVHKERCLICGEVNDKYPTITNEIDKDNKYEEET